jgi:molybdopterin converting factor small subunit
LAISGWTLSKSIEQTPLYGLKYEEFAHNFYFMQIIIHFAGIFKALSGIDQDRIDVPECTTVAQLSRELGKKYKPLPFESPQTYFVVNDKIVQKDHTLSDGDHIRIFQLIAGG